MDFFYGSSNDMQASKVHSFDGDVVSPINAQSIIGGGRFYPGSKIPILDPYASSDSSSNTVSPLARYLRSGSPVPFTSDSPKHRSLINTSSGSRSGVSRSPLAPIENIEIPSVFRTPVKVEEDVVVMDGILVESKHGPRAKLSPSTSDSGGRLSSSSSRSVNSFHKSETCRWWEDFGTCRFGSNCRFVHGNEDLRPTAFANRNQSEAAQFSRSYSSGSHSYGPRGQPVHQQVHSTASSTTEAAAIATTPTTTSTVKKADKEPSSSDSSTTSISNIAVSGTNWCPLDDNIEVTLPSTESCASRKDVDAHIHTVLYGSSGRKRLPVFIDFVEE